MALPVVSVPVHVPLSAMVLIPAIGAVVAPLLQLVAAVADVVHVRTGVAATEGATPGEPVTTPHVMVWPMLLMVWMRRFVIVEQDGGTKPKEQFANRPVVQSGVVVARIVAGLKPVNTGLV